ncbi:MAG: hypothetical protein QOK40_2367 [Miltoncostaeaceae bacterium]|jgi:hypothetical protein|nr:hypothetical protein [Miltoncostaeaceae bacterium]
MEGTPETGVVDRRRLEEELRRLEAELAVPEREAAGELSDVDQHQADQATETFDREWALGRIEDLRARLDAAAGGVPLGRVVRPGVVTAPPDPDDDTTPLDSTKDPDESGEIYQEGRTIPHVGEPEPGDDALEGSYRPD